MVTYDYEYTDTFGGEANYSWCTRGRIEVADGTSNLAVVRRVKKALGLEGCRCRKEVFCDLIALYPAGSCTAIFIS